MKSLLIIYPLVFILSSCKKDNSITEIPHATITYNLLDSMKLLPSLNTSDPVLYNNYNDKVYKLNTTKARGSYKQDGNDIVLLFEDSVQVNMESAISITFKGKNPTTLSGTYTATDEVYYKSQQRLSPNSWIFDVQPIHIQKGKIVLEYDAITKTISGSVEGLQYSFDVYVPYYFSGSIIVPSQSVRPFLLSSGSFRRHDITFSFIRNS